MKTLVIYETLYGNTEKIARAIAGALSGEVVVKNITETNMGDLAQVNLLLMGSATQGGRPMKLTQSFLEKLQDNSLKGLPAAAFDTRLSSSFVKLFGWAAKRTADTLKRKGAELILEPEGFLVTATKGPEKNGELERAAAWGKKVMEALNRRESFPE